MSTLIMQFIGPLQSWGDSSKYRYRYTRHEPTKSGIIGLLAAALGRERNEDVSDLVGLKVAVRVDQEGQVYTDYHTVDVAKKMHDAKVGAGELKSSSTKITHRQYLTDARYLVCIEGSDDLITELVAALQAPVFPLSLGRKSCVPSKRVFVGVSDKPLREVVTTHPWLATEQYKRKHRNKPKMRLKVVRDVYPDDDSNNLELINDIPVCFIQGARKYTSRYAKHDSIEVVNDKADKTDYTGTAIVHDPFSIY